MYGLAGVFNLRLCECVCVPGCIIRDCKNVLKLCMKQIKDRAFSYGKGMAEKVEQYAGLFLLYICMMLLKDGKFRKSITTSHDMIFSFSTQILV